MDRCSFKSTTNRTCIYQYWKIRTRASVIWLFEGVSSLNCGFLTYCLFCITFIYSFFLIFYWCLLNGQAIWFFTVIRTIILIASTLIRCQKLIMKELQMSFKVDEWLFWLVAQLTMIVTVDLKETVNYVALSRIPPIINLLCWRITSVRVNLHQIT